jgi:hypothetical protein
MATPNLYNNQHSAKTRMYRPGTDKCHCIVISNRF